jgi:MFS superfamily sulfate permease-like transporter
VAGAIAASWALDFGSYMHVLGAVPSGLPNFTLPGIDWNLDLFRRLTPIAFAMFVVILAQGAATSRAFAAKYNESFDQNVDLNAMGLANIGAGLTGTFVVAGSPTKTQMVDSAGGRTQLTHLTAVGVVVLVLLFFTAPLAYMPESVLAAIVFLIGLDLVKAEEMKNIYRQRQSEFWVAAITALMVVFVGVEQGILLAIVLSIIDHTRRGYQPKNAVLERIGTRHWKTHPVASHVQAVPGLMIYRFTFSMYYANSRQLSEEVTALMSDAQPPLRWLCIDLAAVTSVDYSAAETLKSLFALLKERQIRLVVAQPMVDADPHDRLELQRLIGEDAIFKSLDDVVEAYRNVLINVG